jgi:phospholipid/cholesterol/gamma-HCH transport system ATP-binding protein
MGARERAALTRRMGMLFQKNALFDSLTVEENIAFPLREGSRASEAEIRETVGYFLEAVGIAHARALFPDEISGGMQKRLGIARALALKPEIVLYDDPTAGLDPVTSRKIAALIGELRAQSRSTIVAVTNDMARAYQLGDRVAMAVHGELVVTGTRAETEACPDPRVQQFIRGRLDGPLASGAGPASDSAGSQ